MFYDVERFPFAASLAKNWLAVRDEFRAVSGGEFQDWPEHSLYGPHGWTTFGLYAFGQKQHAACKRCPQTDQLLQRVPGLMMAGFSRLDPGAHIVPHRGYEGYSGYVLRLHLGLDIPDNCALRVGDETRTWRDGECVVFDDSMEHEAWNRSDRPRTVLLLDFMSPLRRRPLFLNPKFTPELIRFIESDYLPKQGLGRRLIWKVWKTLNPSLVRQAASNAASDRPS